MDQVLVVDNEKKICVDVDTGKILTIESSDLESGDFLIIQEEDI